MYRQIMRATHMQFRSYLFSQTEPLVKQKKVMLYNHISIMH